MVSTRACRLLTIQSRPQHLRRCKDLVSTFLIRHYHSHERFIIRKAFPNWDLFVFSIEQTVPHNPYTQYWLSHRLDLDRAEFLRWLKSHDPYTNHLAAQRKKQAHTGSWFLHGEQYTAWQCGKIPLLWISGSRMFPLFLSLTLTDRWLAGSGKTVLWSVTLYLQKNFADY